MAEQRRKLQLRLRSKKLAIIVTSIYILGVLHAIGLILSPQAESLSGIPAILLTLPWSMLLLSILNLISPAMGTTEIGLLVVCSGAILNAMIIYRIFRGKQEQPPVE